ncbi:MAG: LutC/YkgG family protein [Halioglobus sp.]
MSSARSEILARLRKSSKEPDRNTITRGQWSLGRAPAAPLPAADTCEAFFINVIKNHGTVDSTGSRSDTVSAIGAYLYENFRSKRLVAGNDPRLAAMPWRDAGVLPRFGGVEEGEHVALSFARLAVAETGAVVTFTGKANPAANNLLPEHHLVLVEAEDIVATLEDAWDRINAELEKAPRPRGINFIAGPSSTGDIEGQLVYGAHGPRSWHVIVVGEVPAGALERAQAAVGS